jgi:DNA (cytosine-5)-methyltransferase 1
MKYIDLFAGCGGLSLGLEKAGFKLLLAVEKSPMAAETFYHNFISRIESQNEWTAYNNLTIEEQFRRKLIVNEVSAVLENINIMENLESEGIDLIAGGPPCQGFSMAGKRNPKDIRNQLPWQFLEMVERLHPKAVLIENVLGIKQNFNKHGEKAPIDEINSALHNLWPGYVTQLIEVNAMHFGVPQYRPRVMILGIRSDIADKLNLEIWDGFWKSDFDIKPPVIGYKRPTLAPITTCEKPLTVRDALWDLKGSKYALSAKDNRYNSPNASYARLMREDFSWMSPQILKSAQSNILENQVLRKHSENIADRFRLYQIFQKYSVPVKIFNVVANTSLSPLEKKQLIQCEIIKIKLPAKAPDGKILGEDIEELFERVMSLSTKKHSQRPLKWDSPSPTVLSLPDDFVHPNEARTMSVREMARLQSFPDSFIFRAKETTGSLRRRFEIPQYTQVGNAVPPLMAEAVGKKMFELLKKALKFTTKSCQMSQNLEKKAS